MRRMERFFQALGVVLVATVMAAPIHSAQVPEKPPKPSYDSDWNYVSPGPAKCVEAGNVYLHRGSLQGALSRFQEALRDDPHYPPAYLGLGKVYERMKEKRKALDAYQRYLEELPSARDAAEAKDVRRAVERLKKQLDQT